LFAHAGHPAAATAAATARARAATNDTTLWVKGRGFRVRTIVLISAAAENKCCADHHAEKKSSFHFIDDSFLASGLYARFPVISYQWTGKSKG